jgi:hypothetical protein
VNKLEYGLNQIFSKGLKRRLNPTHHRFLLVVNKSQNQIAHVTAASPQDAAKHAVQEGYTVVDEPTVRTDETLTQYNDRTKYNAANSVDYKPYQVMIRVPGQDVNAYIDASTEQQAVQYAEKKGYNVTHVRGIMESGAKAPQPQQKQTSQSQPGRQNQPNLPSRKPLNPQQQSTNSDPNMNRWKVLGRDKKGRQFDKTFIANISKNEKEVRDRLAELGIDVLDLEVFDQQVGKWVNPDQLQRTPIQTTPDPIKKAPANQAQGPRFKYEAMDHTGKETSGFIEAEDQNEAVQLLRQKGLFATKITDTQEQQPWYQRWFGKAASLEQNADLIRDTLGMSRTADLVRQAAQVAQAVQETVQTDQDIDPVVVSAIKQASHDILTVTDHLRQSNNITAHRIASQIEQDFTDALSFRIGA